MPVDILTSDQERRALIATPADTSVLSDDTNASKGQCGEAYPCSRSAWLVTVAVLSVSLLLALVAVTFSGNIAAKVHELAAQRRIEDYDAAMGDCMPMCPRRLSEEEEDGLSSLEKCLESCPSNGFMAAMQYGECKAKCERKHPSAGKQELPAADPPLEGCQRQCRQHKGNFWHLVYSDCAKTCAAKTAVAQVQYMQKYNISSQYNSDLQAEVTALLRTRIQFKKRSGDRPFSFTLMKYQAKVEDALAKVLEIPDKVPKPTVIIRPYQAGIQHVVPRALNVDPGNDIEAVVDMKVMPISKVKKLAKKSALEQFDQELKQSLFRDPETVGLANVSPTEALESTSSSVEGDYISLGWHTVCRMNQDDATIDAQGKARVIHGQSLRQCSMLCNDWNLFCYGFEFASHTGRCEIWTTPICAHSQANVPGSSFVDFRCFQRCRSGD